MDNEQEKLARKLAGNVADKHDVGTFMNPMNVYEMYKDQFDQAAYHASLLTPSDLAQLAARHGLALVPLEPTLDMKGLALDELWSLFGKKVYIDHMRIAYKTMIEAGKVK